MQKINYKSDLDMVLDLLDGDGVALGWPQGYDWELRLWSSTTPANIVTVGCRHGVPFGCYDDGGHIHVKTDNPGFGPGTLCAAIHVATDDLAYRDGRRDLWNHLTLSDEVRLVADGVVPAAVDITALMPFIPVDYTDTYITILETVNKALEELLAGNIKPTPPTPPATGTAKAAPKGDPLCGRVLRRGFMPSGAMPGEVYKGRPVVDDTVEAPRDYVIKVSFTTGSDTAVITELFGAAFDFEDITGIVDGSISPVGGEIVARRKNTGTAMLIKLRYSNECKEETRLSPLLTKNAKGQLILAGDSELSYRQASLPPAIRLLRFKKGRDESCLSYFLDDRGVACQVQWRHSKPSARNRLNFTKNAKKWRSFSGDLPRCGVIRIRRRTRTAASEWVYYTTWINTGSTDARRYFKRI